MEAATTRSGSVMKKEDVVEGVRRTSCGRPMVWWREISCPIRFSVLLAPVNPSAATPPRGRGALKPSGALVPVKPAL